ncbi:F-box only protein 24 isoform X3 [Podarcis raffonei]|uniref:F-box only protein 24 isoform X3 n=1 Tax=Podarcis raffonei TaxID=65483 RepID=UPI00232962C2|nr:F-box only protein 24 isoform X3 [Podarcis raffonei]
MSPGVIHLVGRGIHKPWPCWAQQQGSPRRSGAAHPLRPQKTRRAEEIPSLSRSSLQNCCTTLSPSCLSRMWWLWARPAGTSMRCATVRGSGRGSAAAFLLACGTRTLVAAGRGRDQLSSTMFSGRRHFVSKTVAPLLSHGYRKFLPTKDHVFILDYNGTLFFLKNALVSSTMGHIQWRRACRYMVLCRSAKDFATDPRSDTVYRKYLYVLATREQPVTAAVGRSEGSSPAGSGRLCDCVEVYLQSSGQRVFKMTFHFSMKFKQIVLVGQETERSLLLLTEEGKIYSLVVNETQLDQPRSYTVQLALRKVSKCLPHISVRNMHSNQSSAVYLTDEGTVYFEVHSPGVYRDLFGTLHAFDPLDQQMPLALSLPAKVLSCALGYNHLGLVDEFGRIFMQGNNRYGQLGTGDKIDRGEPAQVHYLKCPIDLCCGLNHTLVLSQSGDFSKDLMGCGCGAGGRLPGWPKGSASFVRLHTKVPPCARRICSTRECLYMLSSHDIEEVPAYRELPASKAGVAPSDMEAMAARACEEYLSQLHKCPTLEGRMAKMKEAVGSMPLMTFQKDFFWEALDMIQRAAEIQEAPAPS